MFKIPNLHLKELGIAVATFGATKWQPRHEDKVPLDPPIRIIQPRQHPAGVRAYGILNIGAVTTFNYLDGSRLACSGDAYEPGQGVLATVVPVD